MRRFLCRWLGHAAYSPQPITAPNFYACKRCREPLFWVPTP